MTVKRIQVQGKPFTVIAPRKASQPIPDMSPPHQPPAITIGVSSQNCQIDNLPIRGLWAGGAAANNTGTITVADNDFTSGSYLILGDFTVWPYRDYTPGATTTLTAAALAAAINRLPQFIASSNLAVVTVEYQPSGDLVEFRTVRMGTVTNFTLSPTTGTMTLGNPHLDAVELV